MKFDFPRSVLVLHCAGPLDSIKICRET